VTGVQTCALPISETVAPIRIRRDAFTDGVPHRDLILSPEHSVPVTGTPDVLIPVRYLVNDSTVVREPTFGIVEYFHLELDRHGILLAEGLPAESYLDTGNRDFFENSEVPTVPHSNLIEAARLPARCRCQRRNR